MHRSRSSACSHGPSCEAVVPEVFVEQPTIEFGRNYIGGIAKVRDPST